MEGFTQQAAWLKTGVLCGIVVAASSMTARVWQGAAVPVGSGLIRGTVVMATPSAGVRPVPGVRVAARGVDGLSGQSVTTNDEGRFVIGPIPAGGYIISAHHAGFVSATYGAIRPGRPGVPLVLGIGQEADLTLNLTPFGAIAGTVTDASGRRAAGATVVALLPRFVNGTRTLERVADTRSSASGAFRLAALVPGNYFVAALGSFGDGASSPVRQMSSEETRRAMGLLDRPRSLETSTVPHPGVSPVHLAYRPVFYPRVLKADDAKPLSVLPGEELDGLALVTELGATTLVSGTVSRFDGQPVGDAEVLLTSSEPRVVPAPPVTRAVLQPNGEFVFPRLLAGSYSVVARSPSAGGSRGLGRGAIAGAPALWAATQLTLAGETSARLELVLRPGGSLEGDLVTDPGDSVETTGLRVALAPASGWASSGSQLVPDATLQGQRFRFAGLRPGKYFLSISWNGRNVSRAGQYVTDSLLNGVSVLDRAVEIREGESLRGLSVVLTRQLAGVSGTITSRAPSNLGMYYLVIFPSDPSLWVPVSARIRAVRPDNSGRFAETLPPGEYYIAALTDIEEGAWLNSAFLDDLRRVGVKFSVKAGNTTRVNLRAPD